MRFTVSKHEFVEQQWCRILLSDKLKIGVRMKHHRPPSGRRPKAAKYRSIAPTLKPAARKLVFMGQQ